ncbi:hypothetical protein ACHAXT_010652 [Thalassiosira profunda]
MSDLAPFVAATLRDKVVTELLEENQKLREKEHAGEYVEITGPNREPVYARGHLRDDGRERKQEMLGGELRFWGVDINMDVEQLLPCPLQDLKGIEIWVRNVKAKSATLPHPGIVAIEPGSSSPRAILTIGNEYVIAAKTDFSHEERRIIAARAAEAHEQSGLLSLRRHMFRVVTEEVPRRDPTISCTFVSVLLHPDVIEL